MSDSDQDHDELLEMLLALYLLSPADIALMATAIETGYLVSMQAAYREAASTAGSNGQDWTPSQEDKQAAQDWAKQQAQGIADTYKADLTGAVTTFLDTWQQEQGDLSGAAQAAPKIVGAWADKRAQWKSQQVSNYSCGSGGDAGTSAFIVDLESGYLSDTETGEAVQIGDYAIACLPETSSSDICATVAGQVFDITERDSLPEMPNHGWCPHEYLIVMV